MMARAALILANNLVQVKHCTAFPQDAKEFTDDIYMVSNIVGITGGLAISKSLDVAAGPGKANWIAASYP